MILDYLYHVLLLLCLYVYVYSGVFMDVFMYCMYDNLLCFCVFICLFFVCMYYYALSGECVKYGKKFINL